MVDLPMRRIDEEDSPRFVDHKDSRPLYQQKVPDPDPAPRPSSDIYNDEIRLSITRKYAPRVEAPALYADATRKVIQTNSSPYLASA